MFPSSRRHRMDLAPRKKRQRQDIVASSRAARAARQREKQEVKGALAIQAWFRGRRAAHAARERERRAWDEAKEVDLPRFLFFYRAPRDAERLRRVAAIALATKASFAASLELRLLQLCVPFLSLADEKAVVVLFVVLVTRHAAALVPGNRALLAAVRDAHLAQQDARLRGVLSKALVLWRGEPFYVADVVARLPGLPYAALPATIPEEAVEFLEDVLVPPPQQQPSSPTGDNARGGGGGMGGSPIGGEGSSDSSDSEEEEEEEKEGLEDNEEGEEKAQRRRKKRRKKVVRYQGVLLRNLVPHSRQFATFLTALLQRARVPLDLPAGVPVQTLPEDEAFLDVWLDHLSQAPSLSRDATALLNWLCFNTAQHNVRVSLESNLSLYCACTSHSLFTMSHADFLAQRERMTRLVVELNAVLQRLYNAPGAPATAADARLRRRGTQTFAQLRDRQSRQQFCEPSLFQFGVYNDEVLARLPFAVPFAERARRFTELVRADREAAIGWRTVHVSVDRAHVLEQGFLKLYGQSLKTASVRVQFNGEQGIDGGGLYKEFVLEMLKAGFNRFFCETADRRLYPDPAQRDFAYLSFLGAITGKAISDGITIEPQMATFFLRKLLGQWNSVEDLLSLDPDLYKNLRYLTQCSSEEIDALNVVFPKTGEPVTKANRIRYLYTIADNKLNRDIKRHVNAFVGGLSQVIPLRLLQMFTADELGRLISGADSIDMGDLRRNTVYTNYSDRSEVIQWFWSIVEEDMDVKQQSLLLRFATSCSRSPLMGFATLDPKFCIQRTYATDALPTASTCMNLLRLPDYASREILKERLLLAITDGNDSGFQLS